MGARGVRGFTLIELLVVIAIIAILAAILFPIMLRAKEVGRRSRCLGNLRQLGFAAQMYAESYNDRYPPARLMHWPFGDWNDGHPVYGDGYLGLRALEPYVKNKGVFFCPSNKFFKYPPYWQTNAYWCSYCYWGNYLKSPLTVKQVAVRAGQYPYSLLLSDIIETGVPEWMSHNPADIEGGNLVYNDGHAKWKFFKQMKMLFTITGPPAVTFYY